MKKCNCCGKKITTYKYYQSQESAYCLTCGEIELIEEPELYVGGYNNPLVLCDDKRDVYSDDSIQDIERFYLTEYRDDDLEKLIEHLNEDAKLKEAYIRGLEKRIA